MQSASPLYLPTYFGCCISHCNSEHINLKHGFQGSKYCLILLTEQVGAWVHTSVQIDVAALWHMWSVDEVDQEQGLSC